MKCFVTKNENGRGIRLTFNAVSKDGKIVGTPVFEQIPEGENFANLKYSVLLEACDKPQPVDLPF